ncbi:polysaccharide deacetylase family protein [Lysinibacillus pakistanensis]|uniref:Polysaccharide deacetylase family protein n=1 Tax=Lysinibacillus pakistanensis TaxID=759811 RepID=A0AAX3WSI0_9BACI|nr:polysaccharide deacetylase family protein [Lysinibacillus pakistanensis]MDM5230131.1 polysaccharide deacetylase family protein [Lysinibacillus pakistanensis]WHY45728.1 polysaccharide deacetylase family protein [Lysinibacillus pakistanensis]WHY50736.1 polysaccharide deacetylase family protein [Lysinibacillus pakistanensis]
MIQWRKLLIIAIPFVLLCMNSMTITKAESFIEHKEITDLNKEWTITFNHPVNRASITDSSITIKDEAGNHFPITLEVNENKVKVKPEKSYENYTTYTLNVQNNIENDKSKLLENSFKLIFTTNFAIEDMEKITPLNTSNYHGQALVTLSYDDGYRNWYDKALPLHSKYNMPGTFNIIGNKVYSDDEVYMNPSQLWVAHDLGLEIASHTQNHPFLTRKSEDEIHDEFAESINTIESLLGKGVVSTVAIPYSDYNKEIREIAMQYFDGIRVLGRETNIMNDYDPYWLKSYAIINTTEFLDVKKWIDKAVAENSWVIIMLHGITEDRLEEYETTPEILEQIMKYINDLGKDSILPVNTKEGLQLTKH